MAVMRADPGVLSWRPLVKEDFAAVVELAARCLKADGGQPFAASLDFLRRSYPIHRYSRAGFDGGRLVCVTSLHGGWLAGSGTGNAEVTTGLLDPPWRRRGVGGSTFDWMRAMAGGRAVRAEAEALGDGAHALYLSRGLRQVFAEDVMQLPALDQVVAPGRPTGLALSRWGVADPARFFGVYDAAFRDRPNFPGRSQPEWIEWISADEDFRADWTLLATLDGADAGFIVGAATGWIIQLGVVPQARSRALGATMIAEVVRRMRSAGETTITLNVNIDNPHAAALYERAGFTRTGRRARYA
jgi:mycothiol synthase